MMSSYVTLVILFLCISSSYYGAKGVRKNILYGEDIPTKSEIFYDATTKMEFSSIECIDIHEQPAFHHPKLKNHKIQMKPSFRTERAERRIMTYTKGAPIAFSEEDACPNGTVPIQKSKSGLIHPLTFDYPGQHFATLNVEPSKEIYHGGRALISLEEPSVKRTQLSGGLFWIENGEGNETNMIAVGWMVNPALYNDSVSRLTAFWTEIGFDGGCYNTLCPGFVQISRRLHLGQRFSNVSGQGKIFANNFQVVKDQESGNWWFTYGQTDIGYWPKKLFTHLNIGATSISFGGVTHAPSGELSPPMGRGSFPVERLSISSYFGGFQTVDDKYRFVDVDYRNAAKFIDSKKCYSLLYWISVESHHYISYGGPGGKNCGL